MKKNITIILLGFLIIFNFKLVKAATTYDDIAGSSFAIANTISLIYNDEYSVKTIANENNQSNDSQVQADGGNLTQTIPEHNCTSLLGDPSDSKTPTPAFLLTYAFKIIRYVAIVLMVVLSIMDFIESASSQDTDSISKAMNKAIKRLVFCVIIFLLPSLIEFVLTMLNDRAVNICINY